MPKFIFAYHGGTTPENDNDMETAMALWAAWFESMGDAVVDAGNPVGMSSTVSAEGVREDGGSNPLGGYSIVEVADKAAAVKLAKSSPIMDEGGSIEVAEILSMMD